MTLFKKSYTLFVLLLISIISCKKHTDDHTTSLSTDEFIHYTVNGVAYAFDKPTDMVLADTLTESQQFGMGASVGGNRNPESTTDFAKIIYARPSGAGSSSALNVLSFPQIESYPYFSTAPAPINIVVTEYGNIGEYIAGNFSATLTGQPPLNIPYDITCSFRVKRRQ